MPAPEVLVLAAVIFAGLGVSALRVAAADLADLRASARINDLLRRIVDGARPAPAATLLDRHQPWELHVAASRLLSKRIVPPDELAAAVAACPGAHRRPLRVEGERLLAFGAGNLILMLRLVDAGDVGTALTLAGLSVVVVGAGLTVGLLAAE